jgi:hypothetical protein
MADCICLAGLGILLKLELDGRCSSRHQRSNAPPRVAGGLYYVTGDITEPYVLRHGKNAANCRKEMCMLGHQNPNSSTKMITRPVGHSPPVLDGCDLGNPTSRPSLK